MLKTCAAAILVEVAEVISATVNKFENEKLVTSEKEKAVLTFETTALILWLYSRDTVLPSYDRLILDQIHVLLYQKYKDGGYNFTKRELIAKDLNTRYKVYGDLFKEEGEFLAVGLEFINFFCDRAEVKRSTSYLSIPLFIASEWSRKIELYKKAVLG